MEGWQLVSVGDACEIVNGGTPKTNIAEYWGGHHLWITPAEMGKRASPYAAGTVRKLTDLGLADCSARLLPPLSVILSSRAPIGHLVINTEPMATNQGCKGLVPKKSLDHKFLFYYLTSIVDYLNELGTGTTFRELSGGKLKEVRLPLPPIAEQKRIVAILDEACEGIDTAIANAEKNLANSNHLFENYLQTIFSGQGDGWKDTTLGTICELQNGFAFKSELFKPDGMPVLRISSIQNGEVCDNRPVFTIVSDYREDLSKYVVYDGDLLIAMSGATTGKVGFNKTGKEFLLNQRVGKFRPGRKLDICYLYYFLRTKVEDHLAMSAGSAQPNLSTKQIKELIIPMPNLLDQAQIVEKITTLDEDVAKLKTVYEQKIAALSILKQGILRKAFAGELITQSAEAGLEAAE
jgi:type I restriction enzyme S subunit